MPQLDKLLGHITPRGGVRLRIEPNVPPVLDLAAGGELALLANPLPSTVLEALVREVLPSAGEASLNSTGEAQFEHPCGQELFRVQLTRGPLGTRVVAEPIRSAAPEAAPQPQAAPTPAPARFAAPQAALAQPAEPVSSPKAKLAPVCGTHPTADSLFMALLGRKGSDLHVSSFETPIIRVSGDLLELTDFGILGPSKILEIMEALAPRTSWEKFVELNDMDFAYPFEAGGCRLRVNYFMDRAGPGMVCRVIPDEIPNPDRLGIPDSVRRMAGLAKGLVLVTGPTGSGKSTTLAAIIDLANQQRDDHILTIEDPIEFVHPRKRCLINQREVGTHTESFKTGLRAALREDPDIVLVGEMRDLETIAIALETAITGHLVFGTLHTSSAIGTVDRIVDQFPADRQQQIRVMLADALKCVVSQTLLKKIGGGRVAALETLFITPAIANLIREGKMYQIASAMQTGRSVGQRLMNDALVELIQSNLIEAKEAYIKCPDKESFMGALKRANIDFDLRAHEAGL